MYPSVIELAFVYFHILVKNKCGATLLTHKVQGINSLKNIQIWQKTRSTKFDINTRHQLVMLLKTWRNQFWRVTFKCVLEVATRCILLEMLHKLLINTCLNSFLPVDTEWFEHCLSFFQCTKYTTEKRAPLRTSKVFGCKCVQVFNFPKLASERTHL